MVEPLRSGSGSPPLDLSDLKPLKNGLKKNDKKKSFKLKIENILFSVT